MKGVVAAGHEVSAQAAATMLRAGGNAFDAAMAGMVASGVPEFVLSSLGGGGFMMAYRADRNETLLYDFFAQTPIKKRPTSELDFHAIHADFGPATQEFHIGAGSTATPGILPGLFAIHQDLCSIPLKQIVEPAVLTARQGITISAFQAYLFTVIEPILTKDPVAKALFAPGGHLLKAGEHFRNTNFADMLEALVLEGEAFFRHGDFAKAIVAQSQNHGGHLTSKDLTSYRVERRKPLIQHYRNHIFHLNPAPSAGGPLIGFALGLLEQLCKDHPPNLIDFVTVMNQTNKARSLRTCELAEFAHADHIAQHLQETSKHHQQNRGTTHISTIDKAGNAASLTLSNGEGNGLMLGDTGLMLNNMLGEEDLHDAGFHQWQTNQRLSSMMSPTLLRAADKSLSALGSGGSNRIRSAILQVASGLLDRGFDVAEAIEAPRLHAEKGGKISYEDAPSKAPFTLEAKKHLQNTYPDVHAWPGPNMFFGGVHMVQKTPTGELKGKGDPRREGVAITVN